MKATFLFLLSLLLFTLGCTHSVHHQTMLEPPSVKDFAKLKPVSASSTQFVVLWFSFDTNYVEMARQSLINKCPNGKIEGIAVRYSTSNYFLSWDNKIHMTGYCRESE